MQRCLRDSLFSGFDTIPALVTDRRTDEHTTTAYTALAQRRAVKIRRIQKQKQNEAVRRMQGATMKLASDRLWLYRIAVNWVECEFHLQHGTLLK